MISVNPTGKDSRVEFNPRSRSPVFEIAFFVAYLAIVLGMTPFTYQMDDIKETIFLLAGPLLMVVGLGLVCLGRVTLSPAVTGTLALYLIVMLVSSLLAPYRWATERQMLLVWSAAGVFVAAACLGLDRRASEWFLSRLVLLLLIVNLLGFAGFDLPGGEAHQSLVARLFRYWYVNDQPTSYFQALLKTLGLADYQLQSTVLNPDLYANYCLLFYPLAMFLALDSGVLSRGRAWQSIGAVTTLTCSTSIFYTHSVVPLAFWLVIQMIYLVVVARGRLSEPAASRSPRLLIVILPLALVGGLATMTFLTSDWFQGAWLSPKNVESFKILWAGALGIFRAHPLLGAGPGSFVIFFPEYRRPDYFNFGLTQVCHNSYNIFGDTLAESGLIGLLALLLLWWVVMRPVVQIIMRPGDRRQRAMILAALLGVVATLIVNNASSFIRWVIGFCSWWLVFGFLAGLSQQAGEDSAMACPPTERSGRVGRSIAGVGAVLGIGLFALSAWFGFREFRADVQSTRGLEYMDPTYELMNKGAIARDQIQQNLLTSAQFYDAALQCDPYSLSPCYKVGSVWTTLALLMQDAASEYENQGKLKEAGESQAQADQYLERARDSYEYVTRLARDYADIQYNLSIVYSKSAERARRRGTCEMKTLIPA